MYPLRGRIKDEIDHAYKRSGKKFGTLPKLPRFFAGSMDFVIGIKYLSYHPEKISQMPSGSRIQMVEEESLEDPMKFPMQSKSQFYIESNHHFFVTRKNYSGWVIK